MTGLGVWQLQFTTPDGREVDGAFLILVSNNPYILGPQLDLSQRRSLTTGRLGVFAINARTGKDAAGRRIARHNRTSIGRAGVGRCVKRDTNDTTRCGVLNGVGTCGCAADVAQTAQPISRQHGLGHRPQHSPAQQCSQL